MTSVPRMQSVKAPDIGLVSRSPRELAWRRFRANKIAIPSAIASFSIAFIAIFAPLIAWVINVSPIERDANAISARGETIGILGGMSWNHPLGVEPGIGYDLLARLMYGSRISFMVAVITTFATVAIGLMIGIASGYYRGRVDSIVGRFTDFLLSFPSFFMIIALSVPMIQRIEKSGIARDNGARILYLILILSFFGWPYFSRIIRSQVLSLRERDYIIAARALGASNRRIIFKELIPNIWAPVIVVVSLSLPGYLTAEAVFSFLGIGIQPPGYTWGLLIAKSTRFVMAMPTFFMITTVTLVMVVLAFNLLGDALRDALDPRNGK